MANEVEQFAQMLAQKYNVDWPTLRTVINSEGGFNDPYRQSDIVKNGVREPSFGPLQMYMNGGLGAKAAAAGVDPRTDWKGALEYGVKTAADTGWSPWMGAKAKGITGMEGINGRPGMNLSYVPGQPLPSVNVADAPVAAVADAAPAGPTSLMDTIKNLTAPTGKDETGKSQLGSLANAMSPDGEQQQQAPQILPTNALAASENTDAARIASAQALMAQLMAKRRGVPGMNLGMLG